MKTVNLTKNSEDKLRNDFKREHAKFIHSSYLLEDDLDKTVLLHGRTYRIAGLWDIIGYKKEILLHASGTSYAHTDSKEVAEALGFTKFRNFVTGKEITYNIASHFAHSQMMNKLKLDETPIAVEETEGIDQDETETVTVNIDEAEDVVTQERDNEFATDDEEEADIDPLVLALRGSEDDGGWIDESEDHN